MFVVLKLYRVIEKVSVISKWNSQAYSQGKLFINVPKDAENIQVF
jgi:hypothetical protein